MIVEIISIAIFLFVINKYFRGSQFTGRRHSLENSVAIITGGNTGIGEATALDMAKQGCHIIIGARDVQKSKKAVERIKKISGNMKIEQFHLDLADTKSIKQFSTNIKTQKIDFLINNAGMMALPQKKLNKQGLQMQYAVNHLGHFYLTYLLWDKLNKSAFYRIINVSSLAHKRLSGALPPPKLNFEDMNFQKTVYSPQASYTYSKLYNVLFTRALSQKISMFKGVSYSLHPGVVRTQLTRYILPFPLSLILVLIYPLYFLFTKSATQGAQTTLHLIYTPVQKLKNGCYYADCALSNMNPEVEIKENWQRLWQISERDLKITFKI